MVLGFFFLLLEVEKKEMKKTSDTASWATKKGATIIALAAPHSSTLLSLFSSEATLRTLLYAYREWERAKARRRRREEREKEDEE